MDGPALDCRGCGDPVMARMITLHPAPKVQVAGGAWDLLATEAGRYAKGLRATYQLWNGTLQDSRCVDLTDTAVYVQTIAAKSGVDPALVERAVLDLLVMVEGILRQATSSPASQQARPPEYRATPAGLVWLKPTSNGDVPTLLTNFTARI